MTTETRALTQRHRAQQLVVRQSTVSQLGRLWPLLDWTALDATYPKFALAVAAVVQDNRKTSSGLTAAYLRAFRTADGIPGQAKAVFAEPLPAEQLNASLRTTTVASLKSAAGRGVEPTKALADSRTRMTGAMARLVLDAGRLTFLGSIKADPAAIGWQRVLGGPGCEFCLMLANRGAVYKGDTADFAAHDHCGCSAEPQYGSGLRSVNAYRPSIRNITDVDRTRVRDWLRDHPQS